MYSSLIPILSKGAEKLEGKDGDLLCPKYRFNKQLFVIISPPKIPFVKTFHLLQTYLNTLIALTTEGTWYMQSKGVTVSLCIIL